MTKMIIVIMINLINGFFTNSKLILSTVYY